jgi:hypothetical protein
VSRQLAPVWRDTLCKRGRSWIADVHVRKASWPRIVQRSRLRRFFAEANNPGTVDDNVVGTGQRLDKFDDFLAVDCINGRPIAKVGEYVYATQGGVWTFAHLMREMAIGLALDMGSNATIVDEGESTVVSLALRWRF